MASAMTNYLEKAFLDHICGVTELPFPTTPLYAALHDSDPTDTGANEITGTNYARTAINMSGTAATSGNPTTIDNDADCTFPTAGSGGWGTITHASLWDSSSGGNPLFHGALASSKAVGNGDTFKFSAGNFVISMD